MYKNILIPTDGSELSEKAIKHGVALAKKLSAKVIFVTVTSPFRSIYSEPEMVVGMTDEYRKFVHAYLTSESTKRLAVANSAAEDGDVSCDAISIEHEDIYQGIIDTAKLKGCDLILMASHGRRGISAIVLGSETVKVLTHSKIPVLVYR